MVEMFSHLDVYYCNSPLNILLIFIMYVSLLTRPFLSATRRGWFLSSWRFKRSALYKMRSPPPDFIGFTPPWAAFPCYSRSSLSRKQKEKMLVNKGGKVTKRTIEIIAFLALQRLSSTMFCLTLVFSTVYYFIYAIHIVLVLELFRSSLYRNVSKLILNTEMKITLTIYK